MSLVWLVLLVSAPSMGAWHRPFPKLSAAVYLAGRSVCHQRPERSFHAVDSQLPVCARCTGIYAGAPVGVLLALLFWRHPSRYLSRSTSRRALAATFVPTVVLFTVESFGFRTDEWWRAASAVPLGIGVAALIAGVSSAAAAGGDGPATRSAKCGGAGSDEVNCPP
jgi:uncharacterized membrane protein